MEIIFLVPKGKEKYIKQLKYMMEDTYDVIKNIPMVCDVEVSTTNWAEKVDYEIKKLEE